MVGVLKVYSDEILQDLMEDTLITDLPNEKDKEVAELIGVDAYMKLALYVRGTELYIQSHNTVLNGVKYTKDNVIEVIEKQEDKKFSKEMQELIEIIGKKNVSKLMYFYSNTMIYISSIYKIVSESRNRKILDEYNGKNHRELGKKYDMSARTIKQIVRNYR